jgi:hypothetical protein
MDIGHAAPGVKVILGNNNTVSSQNSPARFVGEKARLVKPSDVEGAWLVDIDGGVHFWYIGAMTLVSGSLKPLQPEDVKTGTKVILGGHPRKSNGERTNWDPEMDKYIGKEATLVKDANASSAFESWHVDIDNGSHYWRIDCMTLAEVERKDFEGLTHLAYPYLMRSNDSGKTYIVLSDNKKVIVKLGDKVAADLVGDRVSNTIVNGTIITDKKDWKTILPEEGYPYLAKSEKSENVWLVLNNHNGVVIKSGKDPETFPVGLKIDDLKTSALVKITWEEILTETEGESMTVSKTVFDSIIEEGKKTLEEGSLRAVCRQATKRGKKAILNLLKKKGADNSVVNFATEAMDTEAGTGVISFATGTVLPLVPWLKGNSYVQVVAKECRVEGWSIIEGAVMDEVMEFFGPVIEIMSGPQPKRVPEIAEEEEAEVSTKTATKV